jgi:hypothetical protein
MIPAFTNDKRKKLFETHAKKGFGFINWDIEEEKNKRSKKQFESATKSIRKTNMQMTSDRKEKSS